MMMKLKKISKILILFICLPNLLSADSKYPYQAPDRFTPQYQKSNYHLAGDIYFYTNFLPEVAKLKHFQTTSPLINPNYKKYIAQFSPNTQYDIFSTFFHKVFDKADCKGYSLPKPFDNNTDTRIIFYSPDMRAYPTVVISRKKLNDTIEIYVGAPKRKSINGSKLTFNIDSFERYIKTTAWYKSRPKLGGLYDSAITFGFAINADDFNFSVPYDVTQVNNFSINFVTLRKNTITDCSPFPVYIENLTPFTDTMKIAETKTKNSNDDLYKLHTIEWQGKSITLPPIVTQEKMNQSDFVEFQNLVKLGNTN